MAKIKYHDKEIEVKDNEKIMDACEELGVPFGCETGVCGVCRIEILKGKENLNNKTEAEKDLDIQDPYRLACQCRIKEGEIEIDFD